MINFQKFPDNQNSDPENQIIEILNKSSWTSVNFTNNSLMEEMKPGVTFKNEFEFGEESQNYRFSKLVENKDIEAVKKLNIS